MKSPFSGHIDESLDLWGSRLFNVAAATPPQAHTSRQGVRLGRHTPVSTGGRLRTPQARANYVRQKLREMVRRAPQVMVKLAKAPTGMRGISNNLTYISRDGQLEIEDQDGQVMQGKEAVADLKAEWQHGGVPVPADSSKRDAFHLVLSMPTLTDPLAVQRAARDFATREFSTFQYAMVLHTFETDPDPNPSRHPHVHLTVKAAGFDGHRLNPRKADLQRWREGFAEALREHGIEATTTSRLHHTTHERWRVQHLRDEHTNAKIIDRQKRRTPIPGIQREVMHNYQQVMNILAQSDQGKDRQLAADLVQYLRERGRTSERDRERPQGRE